jgi:hypothetical protein
MKGMTSDVTAIPPWQATASARMTGPPPANAICLGGPCHGKVTRIDQDIGMVTVPLPSPATGTADYHVTAESIHHPSSRDPLTVLRWNHAVPPGG